MPDSTNSPNTKLPLPALKVALESLPTAVIVLDQSHTIHYANRAAIQLAGDSGATDIIGMCYDDILAQCVILDEDGTIPSPASYPSTVALTQGRALHNVIYEQVYCGRHAWLSVSSVPVFGKDGKVELAVVYFTDISQRKKRTDKLDFLVKSSEVLSITTDFDERLVQKARLTVPRLADWCTVNVRAPDGSVQRIAVVHRDPAKVALVAELAERSFKDSVEPGVQKVMDTGIAEFYPNVSTEFLARSAGSAEQLALAQASGVVSSMILPIISRDKVLGALSLAYAESGRTYTTEDFEFMQKFCHHIGILLDNVRMYEEIRQRDKAKDMFLATLSHELRNPLAPIKSSLELLRIQNGYPEFTDQLDIIEHQFDHMTKLLNDLLDATRFTQGKIQLEKKHLHLQDSIRKMIRTNHSFIGSKNISLEVSMPPQAIWVEVDETRLQQALMNLLHNAEKFTPAGGRVWVQVHADQGTAVVSVRDSGIGISKEDLAQIFELHFQGARKAGYPNSGLGIGLVLVQEIMRLHDGSVTAHSNGVGQGSTFTLTFPLFPAPETEAAQKANEGTPAPGTLLKKILVVDDNAAAAKGLELLFAHFGHATRVAHTGRSAVEIARDFMPDIALLDIGLPDIDGYQVAKELRDALGKRVVLVAITGYGQEEDKAKALSAGFDHHLTKPVSIASLEQLLRALPYGRTAPATPQYKYETS